VTSILADTSVWMRRAQPEVSQTLAGALAAGIVVTTAAIELELLSTARDAHEHRELAREYRVLPRVPLGSRVEQRALDVQTALVRRGYHRGPSPVDLLAAAAAEDAGTELWHCDRHFELIAEVTRQPMRRLGE
jgi:predicted nucleic acid-binding protein